MTTAANESSFKNEADLFIRQVSVGTGSTEAQKRFSSFKDVSISIVPYGGKTAIKQPITQLTHQQVSWEISPLILMIG